MSADSSIIRTRRDRNNPYTMVNKSVFENNNLSWEARGILAYLLTKPDDWQVRTSDLLQQAPQSGSGKCGGDKLARILKELEDAGYLIRERRNIAGGRFEWVTTVYENPLDAAEVAEKAGKRRRKTSAPLPENPVMVAQHQEAKSTITGFTINGSAINGKPAYIVTTDLTKEEISTNKSVRSARKRADAPAQIRLDSVHEGVTIWKRLTGKRTIAPILATLIADSVTDMPRWERAATAWIQAGNKPDNVQGIVDWYYHPERIDRAKARRNSAPEPNRPIITNQPSIAPDANSQEETARKARAAYEAKRGKL